MKQTLLRLYDLVWLPLLLVVGTSWLYAPWLHHQMAAQLQIISDYEGRGAYYGWLFRLGDALGALLIITTTMRTGLLRRQGWLGALLIIVAGLSIIDVTFIVGCHAQCTTWDNVSVRVHDIESLLSVIALAAATLVDWLRNKQLVSRIFFIIQLLFGLLAASTLLSKQALYFMQFVYQPLTIAWITYVLHRYVHVPTKLASQHYARLSIATLLFMGGLLEISSAFHIRAHNDVPLLLAQHAVLVGAIMLYLSRQIYRGQRRAAIIIVVVLLSQAIKYALIVPRLYPLALSEITLIALWFNWSAFNRNTGVPPLVSRLKNLLLLGVGSVAAILLVFLLAHAAGQQRIVHYEARHVFSASRNASQDLDDHEDRFEARLSRLRYVSASLGVVLVVFVLGTLFQPATNFAVKQLLEPADVERLLRRYSTSSEDFFKLWPADKSYFTDPAIDGFIAYKKVGSTVFCLANPICAPTQQPQLLAIFMATCRAHGWSACFMIVDAPSLALYEAAGLKTLQIGSSAVVPIDMFSSETARDKWWRWQLNRAAKAGLRYSVSQPPHAADLLDATAAVSAEWLQRAGHSEQGFALGYYDAAYLQLCTLHTLSDTAGNLVAFTNQLPTYNDNRQVTVDLIRFKPDVNGAMPVLIAQLIQNLAAAGKFMKFDLGFVPLAKVDTTIATLARRLATGRFSAAGLEQFKGKFKPDWQPQYLAYDGDLIDLTALVARLEKALQR